jgi:drug/metabolite transporter (DMT)-like permease
MRKPVDGSAAALMVVLCLVWGFQQVAIKAVAADVTPILQVALRSGVSALLVWLFSRLIARDLWLSGVGFRAKLLVGVLFAAEFLFMTEGLRWTTASHMAVFLYTAPMFAAIGLHLKLPEERLDWPQWTGIALAFVGIAITFLGPHVAGRTGPASPSWLLGDFMGLCAGLGWGLTTVAVRTSHLNDAPATQTLFYQLVGAFVVLLPFAIATGQGTFRGSTLAWASLGFQALVVSFASYLAWFWLLRRYLAARLGVLSFMAPLFGVALGALLLHEHLDPAFLAGSALVVLGLLAVNGHGLLRKTPALAIAANGRK